MGKRNVADGNDRVAVQVGRIEPAGDRDRSGRDKAARTEAGATTNTRSGNATVGRQEDTITGGLNIGR